MHTFFNVQDIGNLDAALKEALEVKKNRFGYQQLGKNKTLLMIFSTTHFVRASPHRRLR